MSGKRYSVIVLTLGLFGSSGAAFGHHSFSADFSRELPVEVTGTVTKVEWMTRTPGSTSTRKTPMARWPTGTSSSPRRTS